MSCRSYQCRGSRWVILWRLNNAKSYWPLQGRARHTRMVNLHLTGPSAVSDFNSIDRSRLFPEEVAEPKIRRLHIQEQTVMPRRSLINRVSPVGQIPDRGRLTRLGCALLFNRLSRLSIILINYTPLNSHINSSKSPVLGSFAVPVGKVTS